jgi:hypothetical protein
VGQAGETILPLEGGVYGEYEGRGVWVTDGLTAAEIMEGAKVLQSEFEVAPYISRMMARAVLYAARAAKPAD